MSEEEKKIQETALIRVSKKAQRKAKKQAFLRETTIKDYVESLIFDDNSKKEKEKE